MSATTVRLLGSLLLLAVASCTRSAGPAAFSGRPLSAEQHTEKATRHEAEAGAHLAAAQRREREAAATGPLVCFDRPLAGMVHAGPEPIRIMRPCWSSEDEASYHQREAHLLRAHAAEHRATAHKLRAAEQSACGGLGEDELSHSPFYHVEDVLRAEPLREGERLAGARVVFRKVRGLSRAWLERAVQCHQARAAVMGYMTDFMGYCPLMLQGVETEVTELPEGFAIQLRSGDDTTAAAVLGRVSDLVALRDQNRRPSLHPAPASR